MLRFCQHRLNCIGYLTSQQEFWADDLALALSVRSKIGSRKRQRRKEKRKKIMCNLLTLKENAEALVAATREM